MYISGIDPTKVRTSAEGSVFALGQRGATSNGNEYVYIRAKGAIAAFTYCGIDEVWDAAEATTTTQAAGTGQGQRGCIPQVAIADDGYGWGAIYGGGGTLQVLAATNCAKYTTLCTTATDGVLDDAAVNAGKVVGVVLEETITTAAAADCSVCYPSTLLDATT
ncbi:MAG TPA: hypothetical protein VMW68_08510 [Methyloceanibacter sp.]|nr:hypothetical protein [Methyloceanibacter sp.]